MANCLYSRSRSDRNGGLNHCFVCFKLFNSLRRQRTHVDHDLRPLRKDKVCRTPDTLGKIGLGIEERTVRASRPSSPVSTQLFWIDRISSHAVVLSCTRILLANSHLAYPLKRPPFLCNPSLTFIVHRTSSTLLMAVKGGHPGS